MNKFILFTFCLLTVISIASSVEIQCAYSVLHYYVLRNIYSCVIRRVVAPQNSRVNVIGLHMYAKNSDDVQGLKGDIGNLEIFPRDINNTFKNLKAIYFTSGQIKKLSSDDLKPFPELVELYFDNNKIEVIEDGTFDSNPKLAGLSFAHNKIMHISSNVFDHLTDLKYLWLNGNPCPNGAVGEDRSGVLRLIATAKSSCQNQTIIRMEGKLEGLTDGSISVISNRNLEESDNVDQKIVKLKALMAKNEQNLAEFKAAVLKKFDEFEVDYKNLNSELMNALQEKFKIGS